MARRREPVVVDMGARLRRDLTESFTAKAERHPERVVYDDGAITISPWPTILRRLEAGEAVEVPGWQLPRWSYEPPTPHRVRIDADGTITVV